MNGAWECFFAAALKLAMAGSIKQRLTEAYQAHLSSLDSTELPKELRDEFTTLSAQLCSERPMRGESSVHATVRKMSDSDASRCATRILMLMGAMTRLQQQPRSPMLRAVNSGDN